jgi:general secretion pathway protein E
MRSLPELLTSEFGVATEHLERAATYIAKYGGRLERVLINLGVLSTDQLPEIYSRWLDLPLLAEVPQDIQVPDSVGQAQLDLIQCFEQFWVPFNLTETGHVVFAVADPLNPMMNDYLQFKRIDFEVVIASDEQLETLKVRLDMARKRFDDGIELDGETDKLLELAAEAPTVNLVNNLIYRAIKQRSSDMHIETDAGKGRVRYRIDGVLHDADTIPRSLVLPAVTRLKILSSMDIAERRRPQDGKIEMTVGGESIDIRVSVLPRNEGESVVMRFLRQDALQTDMSVLGMAPDIERKIKEDLARTSGVILLTGPTGSGKTTSLYSFLAFLNSPAVKIITLEDPVEYQLEGINQVQVQPEIGFDFAAGLRSVVRQDPDIIMLGEIRDKETAAIAMQSALTGHLVFSTVHTNDAPSAYTRLLDLGVDDFLLNAALVSIIAQRLARKLCDHCKAPDPEAAAHIEQYHLKDYAKRFGLTDIQLMHPVGCERCDHKGYKGRTAIMEYLRCDDAIKSLPKDANFVGNARKLLIERGDRNLLEDGLYKAICGHTTISEVMRVAG